MLYTARFNTDTQYNKPSGAKIGMITSKLRNATLNEYSFNDFVECLRNGYTWENGIFNGIRNDENFVKSNLIALDIDEFNEDTEFWDEYKTIEMLEENGYIVNVAYRTHTYSEKKPKHRIVLAFNDYLKNDDVTRSIILQIDDLLNNICDNSVVKNPFRLLFCPPNTVYHTNDKLNDLNKIKELSKGYTSTAEPKRKQTKQTKRISNSKHTKIKDIKIKDLAAYKTNYKAYIQRALDNNGNFYPKGHTYHISHHDKRYKFYSLALLVYDLYQDIELIELFLKCLITKQSEYIDYMKHDLKNKKYLNATSYKLLNELQKTHNSKDVKDVFDILKHYDNSQIVKNYIDHNRLKKQLVNGANLVVASAGIGKTTSFINIVLDDEKKAKGLVLVPTLLLAQDLEKKLIDKGIKDVSIFCTNKNIKNDGKITICTYDKIYNVALKDYKYILVDEYHLLASYQALSEHKRNIYMSLYDNLRTHAQYVKNVEKEVYIVYATASPLNLYINDFDNIIVFKTKANEKVKTTIYKQESKSNTQHVIKHITQLHSKGRKFLVYFNSKKGLEELKQALAKKHIHVTLITSSHAKNKAELIRTKNVSTGILCTSTLNVGVDLQGTVDEIIYIQNQSKNDINDIIQIFRRDRQAPTVSIFVHKSRKINYLYCNTDNISSFVLDDDNQMNLDENLLSNYDLYKVVAQNTDYLKRCNQLTANKKYLSNVLSATDIADVLECIYNVKATLKNVDTQKNIAVIPKLEDVEKTHIIESIKLQLQEHEPQEYYYYENIYRELNLLDDFTNTSNLTNREYNRVEDFQREVIHKLHRNIRALEKRKQMILKDFTYTNDLSEYSLSTVINFKADFSAIRYKDVLDIYDDIFDDNVHIVDTNYYKARSHIRKILHNSDKFVTAQDLTDYLNKNSYKYNGEPIKTQTVKHYLKKFGILYKSEKVKGKRRIVFISEMGDSYINDIHKVLAKHTQNIEKS